MAFKVSYTDHPDSEHGDDDTYEVLRKWRPESDEFQ